MTMDIYPTVSDLIGAVTPEDIDGLSFKNHLLKGEKIRERSLFWEFNSNLAMRKNQWKMVIGRKNKIPELYNLQDDLGETSNMAEEKPELIKEMLKEMESWKKHVDF